MYKIIYLKQSRSDIKNIFSYISIDNMLIAIEVRNNIKNTINYLKDFPYLGVKYDEEFRRLVNSKYKFNIIYKVREKEKIIEIISIFKNQNTF